MTSSSPLDQFLKWEKEIPKNGFLQQPFNDIWKTWTWAQAGGESRRLAAALQALGLPPQSHIAILSKNCAHWIMADLAIMMAGYISIPVYPTLSDHAIKIILEHSETKAIIIGKLDDYTSQRNGIPAGVTRIGMELYGIKEQYSWEELVKKNSPLNNIYSWQQDDLLTVIYTSGTTGKSKGVMHTAGNFDTVLKMAVNDLKLPHQPDLFSYLPLSHSAERIGIEINAFYTGAKISFAESLENFSKNLNDIQPHLFFAVPRIWAKFREGIISKLPQKKLSFLLSIPIISSVIKKSIKKKLGLSRASHIYSAAAPISFDLLMWFKNLNITILQAYGMTEDCVYSHFCSPHQNRFGSVGRPLKGLKSKIAEDGEIRVKSEANMKGYYHEPELTAQSFDEENYLKTGDMGEYDKDGFLYITGRIKDQFKTDKGKYISPAPIELKLLTNADIDQACVVGTGIPQPIALISLSDIGNKKPKDELIISLVNTLSGINPLLEKFEMLEKIVIMKESWTIANGMITPTLKVKRNEIEKIHLPKYPKWFEKEETVVWE